MTVIPDFGAHAVWVWSAYGATFAILLSIAGFSWSAARRADQDEAPADAPPVAQARRIDDA